MAVMIRDVARYGDPVLRQKGERVEKMAPAVRALVEDLIETIYEAKRIGLAAQQIGHVVHVTVVDVDSATKAEFKTKLTALQ